MPCTCAHAEPFRIALAAALRDASLTPGAFHVARNGGCEQTLRPAVLRAAEAVGCTGYTEVQRERAAGKPRPCDLELQCDRCRELWCRMELKHNFACQGLTIQDEQFNGVRDLRSVVRRPAAVQLLLHQITALVGDAAHSEIAARHNGSVPTAYKKFSSDAHVRAGLSEVGAIMGWQPFGPPVTLPAPRADPARVELWFWLFEVPQQGPSRGWRHRSAPAPNPLPAAGCRATVFPTPRPQPAARLPA